MVHMLHIGGIPTNHTGKQHPLFLERPSALHWEEEEEEEEDTSRQGSHKQAYLLFDAFHSGLRSGSASSETRLRQGSQEHTVRCGESCVMMRRCGVSRQSVSQ